MLAESEQSEVNKKSTKKDTLIGKDRRDFKRVYSGLLYASEGVREQEGDSVTCIVQRASMYTKRKESFHYSNLTKDRDLALLKSEL